MAEFLLELYSEEIPPKLQIDARNQLKSSIENFFKDKGIEYKEIKVLSCGSRFSLFCRDIRERI